MQTLVHKFVETIPENLEEGILYISMERRIAIHLCACGCRNEVVTPFSPTDWTLYFFGESVSLYPSIGNWSFECRSHYWIRKNKIVQSDKWDDEKINRLRHYEKEERNTFYSGKENMNETNYSKSNKKKKKSWIKGIADMLHIKF